MHHTALLWVLVPCALGNLPCNQLLLTNPHHECALQPSLLTAVLLSQPSLDPHRTDFAPSPTPLGPSHSFPHAWRPGGHIRSTDIAEAPQAFPQPTKARGWKRLLSAAHFQFPFPQPLPSTPPTAFQVPKGKQRTGRGQRNTYGMLPGLTLGDITQRLGGGETCYHHLQGLHLPPT